MQKLIIEARVNEYAMRHPNPRVPWTVEDIAADAVACREAGAAVLHFHAREPDGSPAYSYERYAEVVRAVRAHSDLLVSPTLGAFSLDAPAEQRLAHILRLVEEGTPPDLAPMAMGSVNVDKYDAVARRYTTDGQIYKNSTAELTYFAEHIRTVGLKPYLVSWNVSFTRQTLAFLNGGLIEEPVYLCLHLTDGAILSGHPGTLEGLGAHLAFLPGPVKLDERRPSVRFQAVSKACCGGRGGHVGDANASSKLAAAGGSVMSTAFSGRRPVIAVRHTVIGARPASA